MNTHNPTKNVKLLNYESWMEKIKSNQPPNVLTTLTQTSKQERDTFSYSVECIPTN